MSKLKAIFGEKISAQLMFILLGIVAFAHFLAISRHALSIPVGDEWEVLSGREYLSRWNLDWILAQHNEHRMVLTKIQIWLLYEWNNWDIRTQITQNFLIYLGVMGALIVSLKNLGPRVLPVLLLSCVFLLSTRVSENHAWGFQSAFHFVLLFGIATCSLLFKENLTVPAIASASFFAILAMYSFSSGAAMIMAITLLFSFFVFFRQVRLNKGRFEVVLLLGFLGVVGLATWLYFTTGHLAIAGHPKYSFPHELIFWHYFLHLIANGFGVIGDSLVPGMIFLSISVLPILALALKQLLSKKLYLPFWILVGLYVLVFSILGTITIGRAGFGYFQARASRYVEFSDLLIPLTICSWFCLLSFNKWIQSSVLTALFVVFFYCYQTSWDFDATYRQIAEKRKVGIDCLEQALIANEAAMCPELYPGDLRGRFEIARQLHIAFVTSVESSLKSTDISLKDTK